MTEELTFPRCIYRGKPDTLGLGPHVDTDGTIAGETAECKSADEWKLKEKDGWRLTRELPASAVKAADDKGKK
jgi:hypothetical protein